MTVIFDSAQADYCWKRIDVVQMQKLIAADVEATDAGPLKTTIKPDVG